MSALFLTVLNLSINASWLILAVIVARLLLRKAPKWISCLLWALVAVRLLVPFSLESALSLLPSGRVVPENIEMVRRPRIDSGIRIIDNTVNSVIEEQLSPSDESSANPMQIVVFAAGIIWLIGTAVMLIYALISFLLLKRKVRTAVDLRGRIKECDEAGSPFILGIFRPVIYVPSGINEKTLELVIAHEEAHLKRHDHWWKPLGFMLLSVYWFNPLCWAAYILLCRDIEAACDEKVIRDKDREYMAAYSQVLLDLSVQRRIITACPLAFGETGVKGRIKGVLNYKKPAFWVIIVAVIACIVVAVCFMTNPKDEDPGIIPPVLHVGIVNLNNDVPATLRSYSWAEDSVGNNDLVPFSDLYADFDHSITTINLDIEDIYVSAYFDEEPDEATVTVRCWEKSFVDGGGDLGSVSYSLDSYDPERHTIMIPTAGSWYISVRAKWENKGWASYSFLADRDNAITALDTPKVYYYSGNAVNGKEIIDFSILLNDDGTYSWIETPYSSFMGVGRYEISDGILTMTDDTIVTGMYRVNRFSVSGDKLIFIAEGSTNFHYLTLKDGEEFTLGDNPVSGWLDEYSEEPVVNVSWPALDETITHSFSDEDPFTSIKGDGGDPVYAVIDGTVVDTGFKTDIGNYIVISGSGYLVTLRHLKDIYVNKNDYVMAGQSIATIGSTGMATGPHLGVYVEKDGEPVDFLSIFNTGKI